MAFEIALVWLLVFTESASNLVYPSFDAVHRIKSFREVLFKPYRIIYEVMTREVVVHLCVDRRRDMQSLLTRRLVR